MQISLHRKHRLPRISLRIMHFLYALLFFLLGTSVVAIPVSETPPTDDEDFHKALRAGRQRVMEKMSRQKAAGPSAELTKPVLKPTKPIVEPLEAERLSGWWRSTIVSKPYPFCFYLV
jgi:hypothetical protein